MFGFKDKNVNVYIVDDDLLLLKILDNQFKKSSEYNIFTFKSGEEFLHYYISNPVKQNQIQVVILDYQLSTGKTDAKDGIEILKYIKDISKQVHVIMLSGQHSQLITDKSMLLGAETCVKKNENSFIRIHNTIKWIISERVIKEKRKQSKITFQLFLGFILIIAILSSLQYLDLFL